MYKAANRLVRHIIIIAIGFNSCVSTMFLQLQYV